MLLRTRTPQGDGNPPNTDNETDIMQILRTRTPQGDGNCEKLCVILAKLKILRTRTPQGDGNEKADADAAAAEAFKNQNPARGRKLRTCSNILRNSAFKNQNPARGRKQANDVPHQSQTCHFKNQNPARGRKLKGFIH